MNVVVIGGGHNGLAAAFYLSRAGFKSLLLEQRTLVGGGAVTGALHPGFQCPTLSHHVSVWRDVAADMQLERHGLALLRSPVETFAPAATGPAAVIYRDDAHTSEGLASSHRNDADVFPKYRAAMEAMSRVLAPLLTAPPPDIDHPDGRDVWNLAKVGLRFRGLGGRDAYRLLRWAPMPIADFTSEWFESELLRAMVCASGISGVMFGPRSAGSTLVHLLRDTNSRLAGGAGQARGGPGAVTAAMASAARAAGAEIQVDTRVDRIAVTEGRVTAVIAGGREYPADAVVSAIDPKTTFLRLVDPTDLSSDFASKMRNYRAAGTMAKVNLALSALPAFAGATPELLSGRIHIGPDPDYLEKAFDHAKYGELSEEPWLDACIPSILDPALAPAGAHVMSIYVHYAPYRLRGADWHGMKETLSRRVVNTLERVAPGIGRLVIASQVITPLELETIHGFAGGHIFHGELALDQLMTMRPLLGYSRYSSPVRGLHMCGAGTHPGGLMSGGSAKLASNAIIRSLKRNA
jgi:phytoene dehydrogenase-like protein